MEFTARELASGIIFMAFVLLVIGLSKNRNQLWRSFVGVIRAITVWRVWTVVLTYLIYVTGVVVMAHSLGVWTISLIKDTVTIGFFVGLPLLFHSTSFKDGMAVVKRVATEVLGIAALLVVYINLASFSLWGELILQTTLLFFVMLSLAGKTDPKTASIGKFFEFLTGVIMIGLIVYVAFELTDHFNEFDWGHEAAVFALSIWLPVSLIPFIYFFGFMASCEMTLVRAKFNNRREKLPLRVRFAFFLGTHGSLRYATSFTERWLQKLANQQKFRNTCGTMREFRRSVRSNARKNRKRRRRLQRNAGVTGVDTNGRWQDRREFHETKEALERLFYSQNALYRHRGGRYWTDPVVVFPSGGFKHLPKDHGVKFQVRDDGQAWLAWRYTVGGFYLGVGGTNDLDAHWRYAGTKEPLHYPSEKLSEWTDVADGTYISSEWHFDDAPLRLA